MRKKQQRFAENEARRNVVQPGKDYFGNIKGKWQPEFFKNDFPITLELGCGRGEYTVGLARAFPRTNFIGIDLKGDRIWQGSKLADQEGLHNAAFLRMHILEIPNHFDTEEVNEIWITFPDPRPKGSDEHRRLTHPRYLELYKQILKSAGIVHLKTDNLDFFEYTIDTLKSRNDINGLTITRDLYNSPLLAAHHNLKTKYEESYLAMGETINYLRFKFN